MPTQDQPGPEPTDSPKGGETKRDELPGVRFKKGRNARYTFEQWQSVFFAWRDGERGLIALARRFGIDADTIGVWVRRGVPSLHRPSFHDRLRDENDIVREAKAKAADRMADEILDERGKIRQGNLTVLMGLRSIVGKTLAKAFEKFDTVSWTKKEKITVRDGDHTVNQIVELPLNAREYASIVRQLSGAIALVGKMESFFCGDVAGEAEIPEELKFTPEELAFIAKPENAGQLPPGMTFEQLMRKSAAWSGVQPLKPGN